MQERKESQNTHSWLGFFKPQIVPPCIKCNKTTFFTWAFLFLGSGKSGHFKAGIYSNQIMVVLQSAVRWHGLHRPAFLSVTFNRRVKHPTQGRFSFGSAPLLTDSSSKSEIYGVD